MFSLTKSNFYVDLLCQVKILFSFGVALLYIVVKDDV